MLSILLAVPSCTYSFWHGVIPTSYFIMYIYVCTLIQYYVMMSSSTTHVYHNTQDGSSALMKAASGGHTAVVQELVKSGATLDIQMTVCC